jgi:hypothetical protein
MSIAFVRIVSNGRERKQRPAPERLSKEVLDLEFIVVKSFQHSIDVGP